MDPSQDAFGQIILASFEGRPSYEVVERDDGFIHALSGSESYYLRGYNNWPEWQKKAIKFASGRVLDVGSGGGRVSLYLQERGHEVTAIDRSPFAVEVCRKRGVKDARVLSFDRIDVLSANLFDTVVMYGNNFGLFENHKKAKLLLKKLHKLTTPTALIIAESRDSTATNDPVHLAYQKRNRKRGRMSGQSRARIRFRQFIGPWFDYLMVSKNEMKEVLKGTGWGVTRFIDSDVSKYIAIIEKTSRA
jgi:SAM-dependent methyltransferase